MGRQTLTVKGLHFVSKKSRGKPTRWYVYAWRGGPCIATRLGGGRPLLSKDELRTLADEFAASTQADPRLLVSLIRQWRSEDFDRPSSPEWSRLAQSTKRTWGGHLNLIEIRWGQTPLSVWNDPRMMPKVVQWRDSRRATPRTADIGVTVLRELLKFGRLHGRVTFNAAEGVPKLYRGSNRADIVWTAEDIDRFCWHAVRLDRPQLIDVIWLASLTGLRRADLVTVNNANVYDHAIIKKALKVSRDKRRTAMMPRIPELDALLHELATRNRAENTGTLLVTSRGRPWTEGGLTGSFNAVRDAASIVHVDEATGERRRKHLHDVRGTFATRLIEAGLTDAQTAGIMGWSPERVSNIRQVYVDQEQVVMAIGRRIAERSNVNRTVNLHGAVEKN